jgi:hypothetical protein
VAYLFFEISVVADEMFLIRQPYVKQILKKYIGQWSVLA